MHERDESPGCVVPHEHPGLTVYALSGCFARPERVVWTRYKKTKK